MKINDAVWQETKDQVIEFLTSEIKKLAEERGVWEDDIIKEFVDVIDKNKNNQTYFSFSWYGNVSDYGWVAYYDFFIKAGIIETTDNFDKMKDLLEAGIYDMIQLQDVCITCEHPEYVHWDDAGKLHCSDGYAIKWSDSFALSFWHGLAVPVKLVFFPDEITKEDLQAEDNAEIRRCYQEKLGEERFAQLLDTEVIDETTDLSGRPLVLMRTKEVDPVAEECISYIVVQDHSTPRKYWICVPDTFTSAREALAWTAECENWNEYSKLQQET